MYLSRAVLGPDDAVGTADDLRPLWPISLVMVWPAVAVPFSTGARASASSSRSSASVPSPSMRKPNGDRPYGALRIFITSTLAARRAGAMHANVATMPNVTAIESITHGFVGAMP